MKEGLLIPFEVGGQAVGTIWVIGHNQSCRFDAEDLSVMTDLSMFAAGAYTSGVPKAAMIARRRSAASRRSAGFGTSIP